MRIKIKKALSYIYGICAASLEWIIMANWWGIIIIIACTIFYEKAVSRQNAEFEKLSNQYSLLALKYKEESIRHEKLQTIINSQSDIEYIQLVMMKVLGLVPEDYKKVLFQTTVEKK